MADEDGAPKKGRLSKIFKIAAKVVFWSLPLMVATSLMFDPTWLLIFHDTSNVMAQAWIAKITPYTEWLPHHLGLKGDDGLLHGVMESFLDDELAAIAAKKDAAAAISSFAPAASAPAAAGGLAAAGGGGVSAQAAAASVCSPAEAAFGVC